MSIRHIVDSWKILEATKASEWLQLSSTNKEVYNLIISCSKINMADDAMAKNALDLNDQTGKKTKLSLWFTPGNDIFGYLTRSERMVNRVAQLLDSNAPVCHFHSILNYSNSLAIFCDSITVLLYCCCQILTKFFTS